MWYFSPIFDSFPLAVVVMAALGGIVLLALRAGGVGRRQRLVLTGLRLAVLLLFAAALLRPSRLTTRIHRPRATVVVLIDTSRSMLVPDVTPGSRWRLLRNVLDEVSPELAALDEVLEIKLYGFDAETRSLTLADGEVVGLPETPEGNQTAIGAALDDVLRREKSKRLVAVVLLSDGAQQTLRQTLAPQDPARRMAESEIPIYTVPFGDSDGGPQAKDVAVTTLLAGPTVYAKNELHVAGDVQINGFAGRKVLVEVLFGKDPDTMEVMGQVEITATEGSERLPVEFRFVPERGGEYKLTLRAKTLEGELVTTNNERSTYIRVMEGGIRVLYLGGPLRVEQRYLRRALDSSPDVNVDFERFDPRKRSTWPVPIGDRFDRGKYDIYILGDVDSDAFKAKAAPTGDADTDYPALAQLADVIDRGAGLMMLGGFHSFGPGGYGKTPLASVLPIEIGELERQNFDDPIQERFHHKGPLAMRPTTLLGKGNFLTSLDPKIWQKLAPLSGANRFQSIAPQGKVLADAGEDRPLLISINYNNGRVLAFAADSTWRWKLHGEDRFYRQFWRQVILWLADKKEQGDVWIKLDGRQFLPGAQVHFTAGARTPQGTPIADANLKAIVESPDGTTKPVQLVRQGEHHAGSIYATKTPGDYTITVTSELGPKQPAKARARFLIQRQDLELAHAGADPSLLASLARITEKAGGKVVAPEQLKALLTELKKTPQELEIPIESHWTFPRQPRDAAILLLLIVGLLAVEWYLRKRWGLV